MSNLVFNDEFCAEHTFKLPENRFADFCAVKDLSSRHVGSNHLTTNAIGYDLDEFIVKCPKVENFRSKVSEFADVLSTEDSEVVKQGRTLKFLHLECVYYLIRGYSASEIGAQIFLSKRTIESYVDAIKYKMHCQSKRELISKAIDEGYLSKLPQSILSKFKI